MCGIAGFVDFRGGVPQAAILTEMMERLRRRGPDAAAVWTDGPCALAHARLSIIDVEGSPQPMTASGTDLCLVYNGELYNYRALRERLVADGERFTTAGDTEVVLRSIARGWNVALSEFDAMFALAAWDRQRRRLLLARDSIGEKPLFYATPAPGLLVFGSEIKAVLAHPEVDASLDIGALRQALRFRAVYGDGCLHAGVRQLTPGEWLQFDSSGIKTGRFFQLQLSAAEAGRANAGLTDQDLVTRGLALFQQSVEERLIADVPVGAFLSGGLDSSLVAAAIRRARPRGASIDTFSVGFEDDPHSELPFAQIVAEHLNTRHHPVQVGPDSFRRRLAELAACRDAPVSEPADVAVAEMSALARQSVKVVLSGEGADEVFGGYPKYALAATPAVLRWAIRKIGPERVAQLAGLAGLDRTRARTAARSLAVEGEVERTVQWFSNLDRGELKALLPGLGWDTAEWEATMASQAACLASIGGASPLLKMQLVDCLSWLPGNMLERGDRMTMAEGLEMRPPFLDRELAAFGLALPDRLKVRRGAGKWIVRQWAAGLLPDSIVNRPKWGFRVPLSLWFRGPLRSMLRDYLLGGDGLCTLFGERSEIAALVDRHERGEIDASAGLWTLLSAEVWYQDVYLVRQKAGRHVALA